MLWSRRGGVCGGVVTEVVGREEGEKVCVCACVHGVPQKTLYVGVVGMSCSSLGSPPASNRTVVIGDPSNSPPKKKLLVRNLQGGIWGRRGFSRLQPPTGSQFRALWGEAMVTNLSLGPPLAQKQGIVLCAARASPQRAFEAGSSEHGDQKVLVADQASPPTGASQLSRKVLWRLEALASPPTHHLIGLFRWLGPGIAG